MCIQRRNRKRPVTQVEVREKMERALERSRADVSEIGWKQTRGEKEGGGSTSKKGGKGGETKRVWTERDFEERGKKLARGLGSGSGKKGGKEECAFYRGDTDGSFPVWQCKSIVMQGWGGVGRCGVLFRKMKCRESRNGIST